MNKFKSGFVSIIGRPNAGKSSLLNRLVNERISIVTDKAQTTRNVITGVRTEENAQYIFMDTPGIHKPKHELGIRMNQMSYAHMRGVDVIFYIMDGSEILGKGDFFVINKLKDISTPVFLLINKIDLMSDDELIERIAALQDYNFSEIIPVSAYTGFNIEKLLELIYDRFEEGPMYYPKDQVSPYPEQFIMAEIIREKVINLTKEEIPHSVAVSIESIKRKKNTIVISAVILVERSSQKGIIIGKQGKMIKEIGMQAREDLESIFGEKIFLESYVRVEKNWRNREKLLNQLGYVEEE